MINKVKGEAASSWRGQKPSGLPKSFATPGTSASAFSCEDAGTSWGSGEMQGVKSRNQATAQHFSGEPLAYKPAFSLI